MDDLAQLRELYLQPVIDNLARVANEADSEYLRYCSLKALAGPWGIERVAAPLVELANHAQSHWVRYHASIFVGRLLNCFDDPKPVPSPAPHHASLSFPADMPNFADLINNTIPPDLQQLDTYIDSLTRAAAQLPAEAQTPPQLDEPTAQADQTIPDPGADAANLLSAAAAFLTQPDSRTVPQLTPSNPPPTTTPPHANRATRRKAQNPNRRRRASRGAPHRPP